MDNEGVKSIKEEFLKLENETVLALKNDGILEENIILKRVCDCRYEGQGYELRVDAPTGVIDETWVSDVIDTFHDIHEREYASKFVDQHVLVINIRVIGVGFIKSEIETEFNFENQVLEKGISSIVTPVYFWMNDRLEEFNTSIYNRADIEVGTEIEGPAIIEQKDSTSVIPPFCKAVFDKYGNIIVDMRRKIANKEKVLLTSFE